MRNVRLQVKRDKSLGELGLIVKGVKMIETPMVTREGFLIAHDLLEHQNGISAIGSVGDELEAVGAGWFTRGEMGDTRRSLNGGYEPYEPVDGPARDLQNLCEVYMRGIPMRAPVRATRQHHCDTDFEEIIRRGKRLMRAEMEHYEPEDINMNRFYQFFEYAKHLLRTGYRKASVRFDQNACFANSQFWAIAEAVDRETGGSFEFEDQEFKLAYGKQRATCEEFYEVW